jgi:hypothetical protein
MTTPHARPQLSLANVAAGLPGVEVTVAGEAEIAALVRAAPAQDYVADRLDGWSILVVKAPGGTRLHVVGNGAMTGRAMVTSELVAIDAKGMLVRTRSGSVYALSDKVSGGTPPQAHLAALRVALVGWFRDR